jgi:hypothetical protein
MTDVDQFRLRALHCERRAEAATCEAKTLEWTEIAIEWHALAHRIGKQSQDAPSDVELI